VPPGAIGAVLGTLAMFLIVFILIRYGKVKEGHDFSNVHVPSDIKRKPTKRKTRRTFSVHLARHV
jgi:hypothetical protein